MIRISKKEKSGLASVAAGLAVSLCILASVAYGVYSIWPDPEAAASEVPAPEAQLMPITMVKTVPEVPQEDYAPFVSAELKEAWEANNDVVGWIKVDGCEIDNRVFQADDNDYYLRRDENGKKDVWGCYFMDYKNKFTEDGCDDRFIIVYGHSQKDNPDSKKFSKLKRYKKKSFAREHPVILLSSLTETYEFTVFACSDMPVSLNYIKTNPADDRFDYLVDYMLEHSYVDFGVKVRRSDQILLLSTCTSDKQVRFVIAAKLTGKR